MLLANRLYFVAGRLKIKHLSLWDIIWILAAHQPEISLSFKYLTECFIPQQKNPFSGGNTFPNRNATLPLNALLGFPVHTRSPRLHVLLSLRVFSKTLCTELGHPRQQSSHPKKSRELSLVTQTEQPRGNSETIFLRICYRNTLTHWGSWLKLLIKALKLTHNGWRSEVIQYTPARILDSSLSKKIRSPSWLTITF